MASSAEGERGSATKRHPSPPQRHTFNRLASRPNPCEPGSPFAEPHCHAANSTSLRLPAGRLLFIVKSRVSANAAILDLSRRLALFPFALRGLFVFLFPFFAVSRYCPVRARVHGVSAARRRSLERHVFTR